MPEVRYHEIRTLQSYYIERKVMDIKSNEVVQVEKFVLIQGLEESLDEDAVIIYTGLYSLKDEKRILDMVNQGLD